MTTYVEVSQALVTSGYLSEAGVEAATAVLADALVVTNVQNAEAAALDDEEFQEDVIAATKRMANHDATAGDFEDFAIQQEIIEEAQDQELEDDAIIADAEAAIAAASADAAAALVAAGLIDEANADAVAAVIADTWVVDNK
jgi:hypothetical protein